MSTTIASLPRDVQGPEATDPRAGLELSVVMPCLNEHETVGTCVEKALRALREAGINGEVIVADNGSSDGSVEIATRAGARVVDVPEKGYGSALMGGIGAARGTYVIMGDADDSYDFFEIPRFLSKLREGYDTVQGCRLPAGGGTVMPGAMPFLHRWLGNPMFSLMARVMFGAPINDVNCGLRGFSKAWYDHLELRCTGMEFANEMIIKGSLLGGRLAEVPTTLYPDGRKTRGPHLRTFRDGWRTLRFYLLYSPRWLFMIPGLALILLGVLGYAVAMPGLTIFGATLDAHTLLFATLFILLGAQSVSFAVFSWQFAITEGLMPPTPGVTRLLRIFKLERGLIGGVSAVGGGGLLLLLAVREWWLVNFGPLDYTHTMRMVIPGVLLTMLGVQIMFASFFLSLLGLRRK